jgi:hypothetical protein
MADDRHPNYEAKAVEDGGWHVVVTSKKHGATYWLYGFDSEVEAWEWICKETKH